MAGFGGFKTGVKTIVKRSVHITIIVDYNKIHRKGLIVGEAFGRANILTVRILKSMVLPFTLGWELICLDWLDFVRFFTGREVYVGVGDSLRLSLPP